MPDPGTELSFGPVQIGLYGKMPAHGDFVRRSLPGSFVAPWDAWLAAGIAAARDRLGDGFAAVWDVAPPWRFALPAGICGPDAVAGVMLPSADTVGRRFPLTVAALLPRGRPPGEAWFEGVEARAREARQGMLDADALTRILAAPGQPGAPPPAAPMAEATLLSLFGAAEPEEAETAAAPPAEDWQDVLGQAPAAEPAGPAPAETWQGLLGEPQAPAPEAPPPAEAWLDLLGDGKAAPPAEPPPAAWLDLLGEEKADPAPTPEQDAAADAAWQALIDVPAAEPADPAQFDHLFGDAPARPAEPPAPPLLLPEAEPRMEAEVPPESEDAPFADPADAPEPAAGADAAPAADAPFNEVPADAAEPAGEPGAAIAGDAPPLPPPERPAEGGWWTLGGGRLPAMVWALPALPPPEAFVHLLETEA